MDYDLGKWIERLEGSQQRIEFSISVLFNYFGKIDKDNFKAAVEETKKQLE